MVKACAVPGCRSGADVPAHFFPKNAARSDTWANKVQCQKLKSLTSMERHKYRVCHKHFEDEAYMSYAKTRKLKDTAFPTLNLPKQQDNTEFNDDVNNLYCQQCKTSCIMINTLSDMNASDLYVRLETIDATEEIDYDNTIQENIIYITHDNLYSEDIPGPSTILMTKNLPSNTSQTSQRSMKLSDLSPKASRLLKMAKLLVKRIKFAQATNQNPNVRLQNMKKLLESEFFHKYARLPNAERTLIEIELRSSHQSTSQKRCNTIDEKLLAFALYKKSRSCYKLLRTLCNFPSPTRLKLMLQNTPFKTGISLTIMSHLYYRASKMRDADKMCVLMWAEMALNPHIDFDKDADYIRGFEDWGTKRTSKFANQALVFMLRGLKSGWKMPISYTFCAADTKIPRLVSYIKKIVNAVNKTGLKLIGTVCDPSLVNVAAIEQLLHETARQGKWDCDLIEIHGTMLIPFYDPPHLLKSVRDNLLNHALEINITPNKDDPEREFASWNIIQLAYNMSRSYDSNHRLMPKIRNEHVIPKRINKMKVKYAAQIFSRTVAAYINFLTHVEGLPTKDGVMLKMPKQTGISTTTALHFFNDLFDSVNGHNKDHTAPLRTVLSTKSTHEKFWNLAVKTLRKMRYVNIKSKLPVKSLCLRNWIKTIYGFQNLWEVLKAEGFTHLKTRLINQDPLESMFDTIQSMVPQNTNPTCTSFEDLYKVILFGNLTTDQKIRSNCEDICDGRLLVPLKKFLSDREDRLSRQKEIVEATVVEDFSPKISRLYNRQPYSALVIRKLLTVRPFDNCVTCRTSLADEIIEKTFLKIDRLLSNSMQYVYFKYNITNILATVLYEQVNFTFIKCDRHRKALKERIVYNTIEQFLYKWCTTINKFLSGTDIRKVQGTVFRQALQKCNHHTIKKYLQKVH